MNETYYYGQGKVYLARRDERGRPGAYRWIGDVSALTVSLSFEKKGSKSSRAGRLVTTKRYFTAYSGVVSSTWHNFSSENLALLLQSEPITYLPEIVVGEELVSGIKAGDRIALAHQNIWSVSISGLHQGVDFTVDVRWGVIDFLTTPTQQPVYVDYEYAGNKSIPIFTSANSEFSLRYEGTNRAEKDNEVLIELYRLAFDPVTSLSLINNDANLAGLETNAEILYDFQQMEDSLLGRFGQVVLIEPLSGITHDGSIIHDGIHTHRG